LLYFKPIFCVRISDNNNLGLALGLSLGLGIPAVLLVIGGLRYYFKVARARKGYTLDDDYLSEMSEIPMTTTGLTADDELVKRIL
jgi:hypothetical protein